MAKAKATKGRKATRKVRDLAVKSAASARVKGGTPKGGAAAVTETVTIPFSKIQWDYTQK